MVFNSDTICRGRAGPSKPLRFLREGKSDDFYYLDDTGGLNDFAKLTRIKEKKGYVKNFLITKTDHTKIENM
jgi:hypothetical protein